MALRSVSDACFEKNHMKMHACNVKLISVFIEPETGCFGRVYNVKLFTLPYNDS